MSDKPMTANELNAESAREIFAFPIETDEEAKLVMRYLQLDITYRASPPFHEITRNLAKVMYKQYELMVYMFARIEAQDARIEALEAAAREREGDGK